MIELPLEPGQFEDELGPLVGLTRVGDRCMVAKPTANWEASCQLLSTLAGGQWRPKPRGLVWSSGKRVLWVVEPSAVQDLQLAREAARPLCGDTGWSFGSISRSLLKTVSAGQPPITVDRYLWEDATIGLRVCRPCVAPEALVYDASAYYYSILCRLPSWTCVPTDCGRCHWLKPSRPEARQRVIVQELIGAHKLLRNATWGCMLGSVSPSSYYFRGLRYPGFALKGRYRPAAEMIARSAYELTLKVAYEVNSMYTHTDCVLATGGEYPSIWTDNGYGVTIKHQGYTHINNLCSIRVGEHYSAYYSDNDALQTLIDLPDPPRHSYGLGWAFAA